MPNDEPTLGELSRQIAALAVVFKEGFANFEKSMVRKDVWEPAQQRIEARVRDLEVSSVRVENYAANVAASNEHFKNIEDELDDQRVTKHKERFAIWTMAATAVIAVIAAIVDGLVASGGHL